VDNFLWSHPGLLALTAAVVLLGAFAIGLFAMRYSTSVRALDAVKGTFAHSAKGKTLRNILVTTQFVAAIALICIAVFINRQNAYMSNYDWGFPKDNIIYLPTQAINGDANSLGQELLRQPHVQDYCLSANLPGRVYMSWGRQFEGKQVNMVVWAVDSRFFDFFKIPIVAGEKPLHTDSISQMVFNRAFLREYGFSDDIVGKEFNTFGKGRIQGITADVNFASLRDSIRPMGFGVLPGFGLQYLMVKLDGAELPATMQNIEKVWQQFSKEPFEPKFIDAEMDELYRNEQNMAQLIGMFGLVIVLIAVMGVYGVILFEARYKRKEIAIRKVSGSTVWQVMALLNRSLFLRVAIAFAIAAPVAGLVAFRWTAQFAYRQTPQWWVYLLGGAVVLAVALLTVSARSYRAATENPTKALMSE
jgi:putative ABC transport system permease protein